MNTYRPGPAAEDARAAQAAHETVHGISPLPAEAKAQDGSEPAFIPPAPDFGPAAEVEAQEAAEAKAQDGSEPAFIPPAPDFDPAAEVEAQEAAEEEALRLEDANYDLAERPYYPTAWDHILDSKND